ncbi:lipase [Capnocytophaga canis]|uniref:lipase n=1 Tax=Capnocytophaga canis TaxID=1848903 RepID=UPI0037D78098
MNPKKIVIFILGVLMTLFVITFFSERYLTLQGSVKEGIVLGNTMIKYPTSDILIRNNRSDNSKAKDIIESVVSVEDTEVLAVKTKTTSDLTTPKKEKPELITNVEGKMYYPDNVTDFITLLREKLNKSSCRIIHYGDSQIEGDRITKYVRNRFQNAFGGGGPGFIPIKVVYSQTSVNISTSENWLRFASFDRNRKSKVPHEKYGLFATFSRFTSYDTDTTSVKKAHFVVKPFGNVYKRLQTYTKFGLHYGNNTHEVKITVYENGKLLKEDFLKTDGKYHNFQLNFANTPKEIRVELEGKFSPDFYGITLDRDTGVSMDNVAMRGEAGRVFTRLNRENFEQMSADRKADIFIFQYGGNTIPYIRKDKQVTDYAYSLIQNIKWVKRSNPDAIFIVIGPSDMSTSENGKMVTYPFLPKLNEEMKKKCLENGVAFWSIYEAMGGENSMPIWVSENLASSDYVHLKPKGTQRISELFFNSLYENILAIE